MDVEQHSLLSGFDPDGLPRPAPESDEYIVECSDPKEQPILGDQIGASSLAVGDASLDPDRVLHEPNAQGAVEEDLDVSEFTAQPSSSENGAGEYPFSSWALLSPDMTPEQKILLEEDIGANGVQVPVDVLGGEVVDGRHREVARLKAGKPPNYNFLPNDTDVVSHLLTVNGLRGHHYENTRALYAYELWKHQFVAAGLKPSKNHANLRDFKSQGEIARLLNVSLRTVSSVSSVLSDGSKATSALKRAVLNRQVKASDAQRVLDKPADIQRQAVSMAVRGGAITVLAAARMVEQNKTYEEARLKERRPYSRHADCSITLHLAAVSEMASRVAEGSVDAIITFPSSHPTLLERFVELATFAAHALKPDGVMAVLTSGLQLPFVIERLTHPDLKWVAEFDYRPTKPSRSGPSMNLKLRRWPLLIYGKRSFRLRGGDDVIEVSDSEWSSNGTTGGLMLDVGFSRIMERLTRPGQLVCNPLMLDKSDSAMAARITGRGFIAPPTSPATSRR